MKTRTNEKVENNTKHIARNTSTGRFVVWTKSIKDTANAVKKIIEKREELERKVYERELIPSKR